MKIFPLLASNRQSYKPQAVKPDRPKSTQIHLHNRKMASKREIHKLYY